MNAPRESKQTAAERKRRFGAIVRARRKYFHMSQGDLHRDGGPAPDTLRRYEQGLISDYPHQGTMEALDDCLRWGRGSARRVLAGGDPEVLDMRRDVARARTARATGDYGNNVAVPPDRLTDLLITINTLQLYAVREGASEDVIDLAKRAVLLASNLVALAVGAERGDESILSLINEANNLKAGKGNGDRNRKGNGNGNGNGNGK